MGLPISRSLLILIPLVLARPAIGQTRPPDSTAVSAAPTPADTLKAGSADTSAVRADSLFRGRIPERVGTLDRGALPAGDLGFDRLLWKAFRYPGDGLAWQQGVFLMDQSSEGQYTQVSARGLDWRSVSASTDGRSVVDPATSLYNLYYASPANDERIEVVTGPRSMLYGLQGAGAALNFVTANISSNRPFTSIEYVEGPDGYAVFDGVYSQNVTRRLSGTLGAHRQTTDGRYLNSNFDVWNVRAKLRYHLTEDLALLFSEHYTSAQTGLNGGINTVATGAADISNPQNAVVVNQDSYDKINRHDLDLTLVGTLIGDTTEVTRLTVFYSASLREYRDEENRLEPNGIFIQSDHRSSWAGAQLTQNLSWDALGINVGGEIQRKQIEGSPNLGRQDRVTGALWGKAELAVSGTLTAALFGRAEEFMGTTYAGAGADASWRFTGGSALFAGLSVSQRPPTFFELFWNDSTVTRALTPGAEKHFHGEIGLEFDLPRGGNARIAAFYRRVDDPVLFSPFGADRFVFPGISIAQGGSQEFTGVDGTLTLRVWELTLEAAAMALYGRDGAGGSAKYTPAGSGRAGLYYWNELYSGTLNLKVGVQGRFASDFTGYRFNPEAASYVRNAGEAVAGSAALDLLLVADLDGARVHFIWENPLGLTYYTAPYVVGPARGIRFGVYWPFLD